MDGTWDAESKGACHVAVNPHGEPPDVKNHLGVGLRSLCVHFHCYFDYVAQFLCHLLGRLTLLKPLSRIRSPEVSLVLRQPTVLVGFSRWLAGGKLSSFDPLHVLDSRSTHLVKATVLSSSSTSSTLQAQSRGSKNYRGQPIHM